jgi:hypothetical protein
VRHGLTGGPIAVTNFSPFINLAVLCRNVPWYGENWTAEAGVELTDIEREEAILLAQFARAADTPGIGNEMLRHADTSARRALRYVVPSVLVVDPSSPTASQSKPRRSYASSSPSCASTGGIQPTYSHRRGGVCAAS